MTAALKEFVEDARKVSLLEAAEQLNLSAKHPRGENPQPCPVTGGIDRFSFNPVKKAWHCRHCGIGGHDAIGMAAHCLELDLQRRDGFLEACSAVLDRDVPEGGERESDEDRADREARIAEKRRKHAEATAEQEKKHNAFRDAERDKARGIYDAARPLAQNDVAADYLRQRGCGVPSGRWLRFSVGQPYWHNQGGGNDGPLFEGPAMIAPFVKFDADLTGLVIGCHITWIDLSAPPKFRPKIRDFVTGNDLPSKKMRGTKKGGVIPIAGSPAARRWLGAEGIENTLSFGRWERFRDDTFYFAAGDLGNMSGPAADRFAHPELKKEDAKGRMRSVMVQGPTPRWSKDGAEPDAMVVPDHVDELVLLADGDSEPVMTASAMARARARHARPGRLVPVIWPGRGRDFVMMLAGVDEAFEIDGADA